MSNAAAAVRVSQREGFLLIQLHSSDGYPRLARTTLLELQRQIDALGKLPRVHGAILTGTEQCFAAGAEIEEVSQLTPTLALRFSVLGQSLMRAMEQQARPIVGAIRGYCLGGGLDLALACHLRVAAEDAVFGHPGASLGLLTGWGGTARFPRLLGPGARARARELFASAQSIGSEQALAWGMVHRVVPADQVVAAAVDLLRRCANVP